MKKIYKIAVLSVLFLNISIAYTQDSNITNKTSFWKSLKVNNELKNFHFNLEGQLRLKNYGQLYDESLFEIELKYDLFKFLNFGYVKRFINNYDDNGKKNGFENFYRDQFFLEISHKIKRSDFNLKLKNQKKFSVNKLLNHKNNHFWRLQFDYKYDIKKFKYNPKIGFEFFYKDKLDLSSEFDKYRIKLGTNFGNKNKFQFQYIYENETNSNNNQPNHILKFTNSFDILKKKKK